MWDKKDSSEPEKSAADNQDLHSSSLDHRDFLLAVLTAILIFIFLLLDLKSPGVTWDEAYPNFPAAKKQAEWIRNLFSLPAPFSKETIDAYWQTTSDHPSLPRTAAAISYLLFSSLGDEIIALRIPSALTFSVLIATLFLFLRRFLLRSSSLAGAVSLALMPCVYGHAHLFSLDLPIMAWWFWAAVAGFQVLHGRWKPWIFAVIYAIAFTTKLQAVFLPFPLLLWGVIQIIFLREQRRVYIQRILWTMAWTAALTPILYIGLQPWLWHHTGSRIVERFFHYTAKAETHPIRLFYFGTLYADNTPWHYPFVIFLLTIPVSVLLFFFAGFLSNLPWRKTGVLKHIASTLYQKEGIFPFLLLHFITPMGLLLLPKAQGYDGCRLFLACFPLAAAWVGFGYQTLMQLIGKDNLWKIFAYIFLSTVLVVPSVYTYLHIHPYYLAYYNELAGGIRGAKDMGMETTYWCDALTRDFLEILNQTIPPNKIVKPMSMSYGVFEYYQERGWLRADIRHIGDPPYDYHLLQCRQGMFTIEEWRLYKRQKPLAKIEVDKTPLFALYGPIQ